MDLLGQMDRTYLKEVLIAALDLPFLCHVSTDSPPEIDQIILTLKKKL